MTKKEKAAEIIDQDGACDGVVCDGDCENECPIYKACEGIDGTSSKSQEKVAACREFLGEPVVDDAVIGTPRTNAPTKTLLDEFAMAAMAAIVGKRPYMTTTVGGLGDALVIIEADVRGAYTIAAAMMKERARRDEIGNVKEVK